MKAKLLEAYKKALKENDQIVKNVISTIRATINLTEKENKCELNDKEIVALIKKEKKDIANSIADAEKAGRKDFIATQKASIAVLDQYLPVEISDEDLKAAIQKVTTEKGLDLTNPKSKGLLIKELKSVADGGRINKMIASMQ